MKRKMLLSLAGALTLAFAGVTESVAQDLALMGTRFIVHTPNNIAGVKKCNPSNNGDGTSTNNWGRAIDSTWLYMDLVKASDTTGCTQPSNNVAGKFVLIYRTTCMFSEKAWNAEQQGARGVVIVNNVSGPINFTMAPGTNANFVTIPVIIISKEDGDAINQELSNNNPVTVSLTPWGMNENNDLALFNAAVPPYGAVPFHQMTGGGTSAYSFHNAALVANTGLADQTNVTVNSTLQFTPTGNSATNVYTNATSSVSFPIVGQEDSFILVNTDLNNMPSPSGEGTYSLNYNVTSANTDGFPQDNSVTMNMHVTSNVFCKGGYDVTTGKPRITGSYRFNPSAYNEFYTWGPLYYVKNGGYQAISARLASFTTDTSDAAENNMATNQGSQQVWLFKWRDTVVANNIIEATELVAEGYAEVQFPVNSVTGSIFSTATFIKLGTENDPQPVVLQGDTWYWVAAVQHNTVLAVGVDETHGYYSRAYAANHLPTPIRDNFQAQYRGDVDILSGALSDITGHVHMYPFTSDETFSQLPIDSLAYTFTDMIPNISLHTGVFPLTISNLPKKSNVLATVYPNPALGNVNVDLTFPTTSSKVDVSILDNLGRAIVKQTREDFKAGIVSFSTESLSAGQYYIRVSDGKESIVRPFTVLSK